MIGYIVVVVDIWYYHRKICVWYSVLFTSMKLVVKNSAIDNSNSYLISF